MRLLYARALSAAQRPGDAIVQVESVARADPTAPVPWLTLRRPAPGTARAQPGDGRAAALFAARARRLDAGARRGTSGEGDDDDEDAPTASAGMTQAYLMLAQAAEMERDYAAAEAWLAKIDNAQQALAVQMRRRPCWPARARWPRRGR